jgi:hypothetical protein
VTLAKPNIGSLEGGDVCFIEGGEEEAFEGQLNGGEGLPLVGTAFPVK